MKTAISILVFIAAWISINALLAAGISLVFAIDYVEVVHSGPFIALVSILSSPMVATAIAAEYYEKHEGD